jgi:hypothetical protein
MKFKDIDPNKTIDAIICVDSETGLKYLIDRKTNEIICQIIEPIFPRKEIR